MDSAVCLAWARDQGFHVIALSVDYGQRHRGEILAANRVARLLGAREHVTLSVDLRDVGGSALTVPKMPIPEDGGGSGIPTTYVPARNAILLSLALALAEARGAEAIAIGVNRVDYSGYPDCRPPFLRAFSEMARVGTKAGVEGHAPRLLAPLIDLPKSGIVQLGMRLRVPFEVTISCYAITSDGRACGRCDACRLRRKGFEEAGVPDPTRYVT